MRPDTLTRGKVYFIDGDIDERFDRRFGQCMYSFISEEDSRVIELTKKDIRERVKARKTKS